MKINFNKDWYFKKEGEEKRLLTLPHDAMLEEKRYASSRNGVQSGYFPGGKYVYEKELRISEEELGKEISLFFEGVYRNATIKINDKVAGSNKYGYSEFSVNITDFLTVGSNTIKVEVDNSLVPNCRWYSGSGIYRPVWLLINSPNAPKTLKVNTISYSPAIINVTTDKDTTIQISDADNKIIYDGEPGKITIENPHLWSEASPYLYLCLAKKGDEIISTSFGIRKIEWIPGKGLFVNGEETLLRGGCIHHDNGVLGACTYTDAEERRLAILKKAGFNALRISHNPASRALLNAADKLGIYILDEAFDGWYIPKDYHDFSRDFYSEYKTVLKTMVEKDYNHPSVIMYSIGNEVTETASKKGIALAGEMRDILHSLDDTRPVTCGINVLLDVYVKHGLGVYKDKKKYERKPLSEDKKYKEQKAGSAFFNYWAGKLRGLFFIMSKGKGAEKIVKDIAPSLDIVGLNYASSRYDKDAKKYPDRLMLGTETMSADLPYNWERVKKLPQLIGDFVWAAWDYIGETCMGWTYPSYKGLPLLANQGMIDITGNPLAQMAFLQVVWGLRKDPYFAVRPLNHLKETPSKGAWQFTNAISNWEWKGFEGKKATVEVYSSSKFVTLYLNQKVIGTKETKNMKAIFYLSYERGKLEAVATDEMANVIGRSSLSSADSETMLKVSLSKSSLEANEQDLSFVEIEFTDKNGILKPYIEQQVEIKLEGDSVTLEGFGSALYKTDQSFLSNKYCSYRGRLLAVLKSSKKEGKTSISISSENVSTVKIEIEVRK